MWLQIRKDQDLEIKASDLDIFTWLSKIDKLEIVKQKMPRRIDKITGMDLYSLLYQWDIEIANPPIKDYSLNSRLKS